MVRYPFTPGSRRFFDKLPIEESFSSAEVLRQAESRLLGAIKRQRYERHMSELIEFSSFFVSALIASQDQFLGQKFAETEGIYAKDYFAAERPQDKPTIIRECFEIRFSRSEVPSYAYSMPVVEYLRGSTRFELRSQRWKLVNRPLADGIVYFTENDLNDFFGDLSEKMIYGGVKNLRKIAFPKQLIAVREEIVPYLPPPKTRSTRGYLYIEELLKHPVADGRHRLTWLVLAPYLVNVKNLEENDAVDRIRAFVAAKGETSSMKRFIEYNVKRAKRNGLMPPTLSKLKAEHPDIYSLLPREVVQRYKQVGS
jgi:hypothetical protein